MTTIIEKQMRIADGVLEALSVIDPYVLLAGGAPRDWYLGREANDLDIYMYIRPCNVGETREMLTKALGGIQTEVACNYSFFLSKKEEWSNNYKKMKNLKRMFNFKVDGMKIQIMQMNSPEDVFSVVNDISCSICQISYKNKELKPHDNFIMTMLTSEMYCNQDYDWSDYHPKKIAKYFKGSFKISSKKPEDVKLLDVITKVKAKL